MVDIEVLKKTLTVEALEQIICGQRDLDFNELKKVCKYSGYNEFSKSVKWFWEIALNEWNSEQRRTLLNFVTSSDRAPINGFKGYEYPFCIMSDTEIK